MLKKARYFQLILAALLVLLYGSCRRTPGWGVLLWTAEEEGIPSGTVLQVYIKSNIEKVWVAEIPREYRKANDKNKKIEIPLSKLELAGSKQAAKKRAAEFEEYALTYAETLQDGLPIRDDPDNSARRVYRLRSGEVIKIIKPVEGNPAISTTGAPLPGEWFRVLTEDGTSGYCFSYRLRLFKHTIGPLNSAPAQMDDARDPGLENVLSKVWVAEIYGEMLQGGNIDIDTFSKHWGFSPGEDTGVANIFLPDADFSFLYNSIQPEGGDSWRFEGAALSMKLRSPTTLAVQFAAGSGASNGNRRTVLFVNLPTSLDDIIMQEETRREALFDTIYMEGPIFSSVSYGRLYLSEEQDFLWEGFDRLISTVIPAAALGRGKIEMRLFLPPNLAAQYNGALTFKFKSINGQDIPVNFFYTIDSGGGFGRELGGVRFEYIPASSIDNNRVLNRASSPVIIYFYQAD
ncbi:MAG: SH3 domain-containing protein [Spirochaetaceae bacterium]|nr:SH3 domain-containing protein [Spirochaetaceae bacterium]